MIELDISVSEFVVDVVVEKVWVVFGYIDVFVNNVGMRGIVVFFFLFCGCGSFLC